MTPRKPVLLVFITAVATVVSCFLVNSTIVPFLNEVGYTTATDVSFYAKANALQVLVRIPTSVLLGYISSRYGSVPTLGYSFLIAIVGIMLLLFSRANAIVFLIAYLLSSILLSVRVLRIAIISDFVESGSRTATLALHQLMNPISNLIAPLFWIQIQRWTGSVRLISDTIVLDRFALSHLTAITLLLLTFLVTKNFLFEAGSTTLLEPNASHTLQAAQESQPLRGETSDVRIPESTTDYATLAMGDTVTREGPKFSFYLAVSILGRISTSIAAVSFQPLLVDVFLVSDARLGSIYLISASLAFSFPLISAFLSRYLRDKELMLLGLLLKLVGNLLYLPLFGPVSVGQLVVGYVLTFRTAVFQTATLSSYTKNVRDRASRKRGIANLNAGSNAVAGLLRFFVAKWLLRIIDGWWFSVFIVPTCLALVLVVANWKSLSAQESSDAIFSSGGEKGRLKGPGSYS